MSALDALAPSREAEFFVVEPRRKRQNERRNPNRLSLYPDILGMQRLTSIVAIQEWVNAREWPPVYRDFDAA
jgi:hypothetical protein